MRGHRVTPAGVNITFLFRREGDAFASWQGDASELVSYRKLSRRPCRAGHALELVAQPGGCGQTPTNLDGCRGGDCSRAVAGRRRPLWLTCRSSRLTS